MPVQAFRIMATWGQIVAGQPEELLLLRSWQMMDRIARQDHVEGLGPGLGESGQRRIDPRIGPKSGLVERVLDEPRVAAAEVQEREWPRMPQEHPRSDGGEDLPVSHPVCVHDGPVDVPLAEPLGG